MICGKVLLLKSNILNLKDHFNRDVGILCGMAVFWPILAGLCLFFKSKIE